MFQEFAIEINDKNVRVVFFELNQYWTNEVCNFFNRLKAAGDINRFDSVIDKYDQEIIAWIKSFFVTLLVRLFNRMKSQKSCGKHFLYRIDFWLGSVLWEINKIKSFIDKLVIKRFHSIEIHYSYVYCGKAIVVPNQ